MFSIHDTMNTLKTKAEIDLPVLLNAAGLDDFDIYHIGVSRDAKEKGFFVYDNDGLLSYSNHNCALIVFLQMYKTEEIESAKYKDVVKNFLFDLRPELLEFDLLDRIEYDSYYDIKERVGFSFFMPYWTIENSDCDIR